MKITNILLLALFSTFSIANQEETEVLRYRYINPAINADVLLEYVITFSDNCIKYTGRSLERLNYRGKISGYEGSLVISDNVINTISDSHTYYDKDNKLLNVNSFLLEFENSIAKCKISYKGSEKEQSIQFPGDWIPNFMHASPTVLYFASQLKPEMVGCKRIGVFPDWDNFIDIYEYKIDKVRKVNVEIENRKYDCEKYTIIQYPPKTPPNIKLNNRIEIFYVSNGKLVKWEFGRSIRLLLEK